MATTMGDGSFPYTIAFNIANDYSKDGALPGKPDWWDEKQLSAPGDWSGPDGNGEEWG